MGDKKRFLVKMLFFFMICSSVMGVLPMIIPNTYLHNGTSEDFNVALEKSEGIEVNLVEEVVNIYNLNDVIKKIGLPDYISYNNHIEIHEAYIENIIKDINNKEYDEYDLIELCWKTKDNYVLSTYISTENEENIQNEQIVGFYYNDIKSYDIENQNSKMDVIDKSFKDIALDTNIYDLNLEKKYVYNTQFKLNPNSISVKNNVSITNPNSVVNSIMLKDKDSYNITLTTVDDIIKSISILNPSISTTNIDKEVFEKIDVESLDENTFKELIPEACIVEYSTLTGKQSNTYAFMFDDKIYSIIFEDGAKKDMYSF